MKFTVAKKAIALTGAVAMLGSVAACGSDTASGKPAQDKDVTEITVWAWEPTLTQVAKDFTKKTGIKVDLKNVGTNTKEYTQLDNAIEAGSGAPDVAQVEYYAIPQYAIKGNLLDITDKTSGYSDFYTPGPWASVQFAGKVYGLPMDSGPMAFFYNKEVFDKAGVDAEQIKTWDQY
ncbi:extracellular solute-binding protein, partial [Bifidobacterium longum]